MKSLLMAFLAIALIYSPALAGESRPQHRAQPSEVSNQLTRPFGWGCDSRIRLCYVGPIWERSGSKGYFRCFTPGDGWRPCP